MPLWRYRNGELGWYSTMTPYKLAEMIELERIIEENASVLAVRNMRAVDTGEYRFPIYAFSLGAIVRMLPQLVFFRGFHSL
jgi:hypothetical protein